MGEVYRADDLKLGAAGRAEVPAAPMSTSDPARLTQLHTEVRMARQVSHPNVCRVYDIDEVDGHTFLSMEYVDGEDLGVAAPPHRPVPARIARSRSPGRSAPGLAAAHERGVIHRDLKPANVMLDGAARCGSPTSGWPARRRDRSAPGTPAYMAPEQLAGGEVTARSDIYALGLVLYEVFTGPTRARRAESRRTHSQARAVGNPAAVGRSSPTSTRTSRRAIMRCLRPDPDAASGDRRSRCRRRCRAAIRSRRRWRPAKRRRRKWWLPPVRRARSRRIGSAWRSRGLPSCSSALTLHVPAGDADQRRADAEDAGGARGSRDRNAARKLGFDTRGQSSASGLALSTDYARYVASHRTATAIAGSSSRTTAGGVGVLASDQPAAARAPGDQCRVSGDEPAAQRQRHDARRGRCVRPPGRAGRGPGTVRQRRAPCPDELERRSSMLRASRCPAFKPVTATFQPARVCGRTGGMGGPTE